MPRYSQIFHLTKILYSCNRYREEKKGRNYEAEKRENDDKDFSGANQGI